MWQPIGNIKGRDGVSGKDAPPVDVTQIVAEVRSKIPTPRDGKDISPDAVREMVSAEVRKAVAALPPAKDGKDAPFVDVDKIIAEVRSQIPVPKDGKDVSPELVRAMVASEVGQAIAEIPLPRDGKDAEPVDIPKLAADVLAKIPVPKDGKDGTNGKDVDPEILRSVVITEVTKAVSALPPPKDGRDGRDGKDGRDGEPGRDALQLDILPAIPSMKSVPRGTFAQHQGGLWRSKRITTESVVFVPSEWEILVDGLRSVVVTQGEDPRQFSIETQLASGKQEAVTFYIPMVIYKGVWREGNEYTKGDMVTWGGSTWYCNTEKSRLKPGNGSADWTLAVKEGRPGKDGGIGPEGPKGKDGRDGRDLTQRGPDGAKW